MSSFIEKEYQRHKGCTELFSKYQTPVWHGALRNVEMNKSKIHLQGAYHPTEMPRLNAQEGNCCPKKCWRNSVKTQEAVGQRHCWGLKGPKEPLGKKLLFWKGPSRHSLCPQSNYVSSVPRSHELYSWFLFFFKITYCNTWLFTHLHGSLFNSVLSQIKISQQQKGPGYCSHHYLPNI